MKTLGTRLLVAMALVALLGVGTVALIVGGSVSREFSSYVRRETESRAEGWLEPLADYYARQNSWEGAESLFIAAGEWHMGMRGQGRGMGMGMGGYQRILILDDQGKVAVDSQGSLVGQELEAAYRAQGLAIVLRGRTVGTLLWTTVDLTGVTALSQEYLVAVRQAVLFGALAVLVAAVVMSAVLSRQLAAPLRRLRRAAEAVAAGTPWPGVEVRSQDEVGDLARALNTMAADLQAAEEQRRQMTADVAHELRNPLSVVRGNLEALLDDVYPLDKEHLAPVYEETVLLQRLVDDLRTLSLAEGGQLHLKRQPVDVGDLLTRLADGTQVVAQDRGLSLTVDVAAGLPALSADPDRLRQVLGNLLANALRLTPRGGAVALRASAAEGGRTRLEVADTGAGIPAEELPHIFERFYRGDRTEREDGGSGLGLSIARALVEAHRGAISVHSEEGRGTVFTIIV